nr:hypothetical protein [Leptotrichia hofstadii]
MLREYLEEKKKIVEDSLIELLANYRNKYPEKNGGSNGICGYEWRKANTSCFDVYDL